MFVIYLILSYFLGSIPFGKIFARLGGVDIQKKGSGNIGFANVHRTMGWKYSFPTLFGDVTKGFLPTWCCYYYLAFDFSEAYFVGLAAIIGHIFPIWLKFKGGKGLATGLGVLGVLAPHAAAIGFIIYALLFFGLKLRSSFASLVGLTGMTTVFLYQNSQYWWVPITLAMLALYTLRNNILGRLKNYG